MTTIATPAPATATAAQQPQRVRLIFAALMLVAAARLARPDDRLDRAADDRRRPRRPQPPLLGRHRLPARFHRRPGRSTASSATSTDARQLLQSAIVIFLIGSVLCGISQNMTELIAFRALQGLGGGGLMVLTLAVLGDIFSPRERGRYQGYFGAVFGVSTVIGPLLGGFFVDNLSWRWIFYVNLPIGAIALTVIAIAFHARSEHVRHRVDYLGAAVLAAGLSAIVLFSSLGGTTYALELGTDRAPDHRRRRRCSPSSRSSSAAQPSRSFRSSSSTTASSWSRARSASSSGSRSSARSPTSRSTSKSSRDTARPAPA